jgi:hypothetical protein
MEIKETEAYRSTDLSFVANLMRALPEAAGLFLVWGNE